MHPSSHTDTLQTDRSYVHMCVFLTFVEYSVANWMHLRKTLFYEFMFTFLNAIRILSLN